MENNNKDLLNLLFKIFGGYEWSNEDIVKVCVMAKNYGYSITENGYTED